MGVCNMKGLFVVAVGIAVLGYVTRPDFPATASNLHIKFLLTNYLRFTTAASRLGGLLGIASPVNITRYFYDMSTVLLDRGSTDVEVTKTTMDGVEVLIFTPTTHTDDLWPGIVHYHGGGWVVMSPETYAPVCREIAKQTQSIVVSVNYRLAPEHIFPAAINDCLKATRYFLQNAEKYGVDKERVGVKGDSAGGNLAMSVALQLTKEYDGSLPKLKFQSLDYPALQALDFNLPSHIKHGNGPGMLRKDNVIFFCLMYSVGRNDNYLHRQLAVNNHTSASFKSSKLAELVSPKLLPQEFQDEMQGATVYTGGNEDLFNELKDIFLDPLFMPLVATDDELSKLPPAYILSVEFDVLRDDAFMAAERLRNVGVKVRHNHLPAEQHGFLSLVAIDQNARDEIANFVRFFKEIIY